MTPDPDLYGPPEFAPDEEPGADDVALFQQAAADMAEQEADWWEAERADFNAWKAGKLYPEYESES